MRNISSSFVLPHVITSRESTGTQSWIELLWLDKKLWHTSIHEDFVPEAGFSSRHNNAMSGTKSSLTSTLSLPTPSIDKCAYILDKNTSTPDRYHNSSEIIKCVLSYTACFYLKYICGTIMLHKKWMDAYQLYRFICCCVGPQRCKTPNT